MLEAASLREDEGEDACFGVLGKISIGERDVHSGGLNANEVWSEKHRRASRDE